MSGQELPHLERINVETMELNKVYKANSNKGQILIVVVPPGHIETETVKTSMKLDKIAENKRKFDDFIQRELYWADRREKNNSTRQHRLAKKKVTAPFSP